MWIVHPVPCLPLQWKTVLLSQIADGFSLTNTPEKYLLAFNNFVAALLANNRRSDDFKSRLLLNSSASSSIISTIDFQCSTPLVLPFLRHNCKQSTLEISGKNHLKPGTPNFLFVYSMIRKALRSEYVPQETPWLSHYGQYSDSGSRNVMQFHDDF